jgi:hypothetical protein
LTWLQQPQELRLRLELLENRDGVGLTEILPADVPIDLEYDFKDYQSGKRVLPVGYALLRYITERVARIAPDIAPSPAVMASLDDLVRDFCQAAEEE